MFLTKEDFPFNGELTASGIIWFLSKSPSLSLSEQDLHNLLYLSDRKSIEINGNYLFGGKIIIKNKGEAYIEEAKTLSLNADIKTKKIKNKIYYELTCKPDDKINKNIASAFDYLSEAIHDIFESILSEYQENKEKCFDRFPEMRSYQGHISRKSQLESIFNNNVQLIDRVIDGLNDQVSLDGCYELLKEISKKGI